MPKTPSEYLAAVQRMTCCTQYPERGDPYGSLEVEPDGGLVRASDFVAAIEAAQAEARAEERARCGETIRAMAFGLSAAHYPLRLYLEDERLSMRSAREALDAVNAGLEAHAKHRKADGGEPGRGDRAVDEARAAATNANILAEEVSEAISSAAEWSRNGWPEPGPAGEEG